jgi:hypothetical protein
VCYTLNKYLTSEVGEKGGGECFFGQVGFKKKSTTVYNHGMKSSTRKNKKSDTEDVYVS